MKPNREIDLEFRVVIYKRGDSKFSAVCADACAVSYGKDWKKAAADVYRNIVASQEGADREGLAFHGAVDEDIASIYERVVSGQTVANVECALAIVRMKRPSTMWAEMRRLDLSDHASSDSNTNHALPA